MDFTHLRISAAGCAPPGPFVQIGGERFVLGPTTYRIDTLRDEDGYTLTGSRVRTTLLSSSPYWNPWFGGLVKAVPHPGLSLEEREAMLFTLLRGHISFANAYDNTTDDASIRARIREACCEHILADSFFRCR